MKILVIAESLRINETSSGIVSSTFIELLSFSGFEVVILTPNNFEYPITWIDKNIEIIKFNFNFKPKWYENIPKLRGLFTYINGFNNKSLNSIKQWKDEILKLVNNYNFNCIYALGSGSEFFTHFALSELHLKIPFYLNIHDPYPMSLYPEPYRKKKNIIYSKQEIKFFLSLQKAQGISFPSKMLMDLMLEKYPKLKVKSYIIPHIGTKLNNLPENKIQDNLNLDNKKINFVHVGTLLGPRTPKFLIEAFIELLENKNHNLENVQITFIGKVAKELKELIQKNKIDQIKFFEDRVSYKRSLEIIKKSDAIFVIEAISDFSPFLPGKVADIVYYNKIIIALSPKESEIRNLLGKKYIYQTELDNKKEIKNILISLINDIEQKKENVNKIKEIAEYVSLKRNSEIIKSVLTNSNKCLS